MLAFYMLLFVLLTIFILLVNSGLFLFSINDIIIIFKYFSSCIAGHTSLTRNPCKLLDIAAFKLHQKKFPGAY